VRSRIKIKEEKENGKWVIPTSRIGK